MKSPDQTETVKPVKFEALGPDAFKEVLPNWEWDSHRYKGELDGELFSIYYAPNYHDVKLVSHSGSSSFEVTRQKVKTAEFSDDGKSVTFVNDGGRYTIKEGGLVHIVEDREGNHTFKRFTNIKQPSV